MVGTTCSIPFFRKTWLAVAGMAALERTIRFRILVRTSVRSGDSVMCSMLSQDQVDWWPRHFPRDARAHMPDLLVGEGSLKPIELRASQPLPLWRRRNRPGVT